MLSRQTLRLTSHVKQTAPIYARLSSSSSRPTVRRATVKRPTSIDSTFFRPSLSRSSSLRKPDQSAHHKQNQSKETLNESHWLLIGIALVLYYADSQSGASLKASNWYLGMDSRDRGIHLDAQHQQDSNPTLTASHLSQGSPPVVIDPDTQQALPLYLTPAPTSLPSSGRKLKLVGLGVRTVSFLRVKVYVAGLYMDESKLDAVLASGGLKKDQSLEQLIKSLLDEGTAAVVRIVPVRNTDFNHLRDGFIRALQGRLKKAVKEGHVQSSSVNEKCFEESIQQIKESFPRGSVPKGSALDMVIVPDLSGSGRRQGASSLNFEYDGEVFGQVKTGSSASNSSAATEPDANFSAARELVLAYFADKGEISSAVSSWTVPLYLFASDTCF